MVTISSPIAGIVGCLILAGSASAFDVFQYAKLFQDQPSLFVDVQTESPCWTTTLSSVTAECSTLTHAQKERLSLEIAMCHLQTSKRSLPPCSVDDQQHNVSACTSVMTAEQFMIFTEFLTHLEASCWHHQAQQWRVGAADTISSLVNLAAHTRDQMQRINVSQSEVLQLSNNARNELANVNMGIQTTVETLSNVVAKIERRADERSQDLVKEPLAYPILDALCQASPAFFYSLMLVIYLICDNVPWSQGLSLSKIQARCPRLRQLFATFLLDCVVHGAGVIATRHLSSIHASIVKSSILDFATLGLRQYTLVICFYYLLSFTVKETLSLLVEHMRGTPTKVLHTDDTSANSVTPCSLDYQKDDVGINTPCEARISVPDEVWGGLRGQIMCLLLQRRAKAFARKSTSRKKRRKSAA